MEDWYRRQIRDASAPLIAKWEPVTGVKLGNDFVHKNRDLAIRVWQEVATDVPVDLVLAGLHVGTFAAHAALSYTSA